MCHSCYQRQFFCSHEHSWRLVNLSTRLSYFFVSMPLIIIRSICLSLEHPDIASDIINRLLSSTSFYVKLCFRFTEFVILSDLFVIAVFLSLLLIGLPAVFRISPNKKPPVFRLLRLPYKPAWSYWYGLFLVLTTIAVVSGISFSVMPVEFGGAAVRCARFDVQAPQFSYQTLRELGIPDQRNSISTET